MSSGVTFDRTAECVNNSISLRPSYYLVGDVRIGPLPQQHGEEGVVACSGGQVQHRVAPAAVGHVQRAASVEEHLAGCRITV